MHGMELVALVADRSIGGDTETASDSILRLNPVERPPFCRCRPLAGPHLPFWRATHPMNGT